MTTKVEYEASYRAAVELSDPLAPKTLHAVLEAAEGARGVVAESEIERLRAESRRLLIAAKFFLPAFYDNDIQSAGQKLRRDIEAFLSTLPHPGKEMA